MKIVSTLLPKIRQTLSLEGNNSIPFRGDYLNLETTRTALPTLYNCDQMAEESHESMSSGLEVPL